jgi:cupin 2 domain-containing protein
LREELFTTLLQAPGIRIERIVSHGHSFPDGFWYKQSKNEWVAALREGTRIAFAENEAVELKKGD